MGDERAPPASPSATPRLMTGLGLPRRSTSQSCRQLQTTTTMAEPEADNLRLAQNAQDIDISDETQDFRFLNIFGKFVLPLSP